MGDYTYNNNTQTFEPSTHAIENSMFLGDVIIQKPETFEGMTNNPAFDFWNDPAEDVYQA
jgi:hypothetical protein